jgi:hypothetical protein
MEKKKSQILWARFGSCGEESWDDGSSLNSELCLVQLRLVSTHDSCWNNGQPLDKNELWKVHFCHGLLRILRGIHINGTLS